MHKCRASWKRLFMLEKSMHGDPTTSIQGNYCGQLAIYNMSDKIRVSRWQWHPDIGIWHLVGNKIWNLIWPCGPAGGFVFQRWALILSPWPRLLFGLSTGVSHSRPQGEGQLTDPSPPMFLVVPLVGYGCQASIMTTRPQLWPQHWLLYLTDILIVLFFTFGRTAN